VREGIDKASAKFNVSPEAAEKAWARMRVALEPGNELIAPFFEKLATRGLVKITRHKPDVK